MKKTYTFIFACAMLFSLQGFAQGSGEAAPQTLQLGSEEPAQVEELTTISFEETSYAFGKIKQGEVVKHTFKFTNTGQNDLKLKSVKPSCGCTALDWPKEPIAPGESGEIKAQFNSTGKFGKQHKFITIIYNGNPNLERVSFTGEVIVEPKKEMPTESKPVGSAPTGSIK